jgi:hypothetical protein
LLSRTIQRFTYIAKRARYYTLIWHRAALDNGNRRVPRVWTPLSSPFTTLQTFPAATIVANHSTNDLCYPGDAHEDEHSPRAFVTRKLNLLALSPDAGAHNDTFCNATLRDWDSSKNRRCECRRDARDNERFETVCSKEEHFFPCTAVDNWVSLF